MASTTLPFMTFHGSFKALSRPQLEQHPRMTVSNLPLRIPVHFQPIKPTSDLQIIIEWIIYTKHPILTSNPQHIHQCSQTLHARRDIKVTLLIIHHGQLRRSESLMLEMPQALINAMQARTAIPRHNGPERLSASDGVERREPAPEGLR